MLEFFKCYRALIASLFAPYTLYACEWFQKKIRKIFHFTYFENFINCYNKKKSFSDDKWLSEDLEQSCPAVNLGRCPGEFSIRSSTMI